MTFSEDIRAEFAACDMVAFDLDGTLLKSSAYAVDAVLECLADLYRATGVGAPAPSRSEVATRIGAPFDEFYRGLLPAELQHHAEALHEAVFARELQAIRSGQAPLFDGARETLSTLRAAGYELALISNASTGYFDAAVEAFELHRWFTYRECLGWRRERPKHAMLAQALTHCGRRRATMVGDKAADFEAARHHGFPSVAMTHGYGTKAERALATVELSHLGDLLRLLPKCARTA